MADQEITELNENAAPLLSDLIVSEKDPAGTPETVKVYIRKALALLGVTPGGRLTLTSGTPVTTTNVTGATTIYYTPFVTNSIALYDGSAWQVVNFSEKSLALGTVTSGLPYDVFGYLSSNDLALEKVAWTNSTTRATALARVDGRVVKSGDTTRLYLGTFYTTSTTTTEDSETKRLIWNYYNRVIRKVKVVDTTNNWTYSTTTWRSWNNSTANRIEILTGLAYDCIDLAFNGLAANSAGYSMGFGVGVDSTSANSADTYTSAASSSIVYGQARYTGIPSGGHHYYQALEMGGGSGTTTFFGDAGPGATYLQAGLIGSCLA